MGITTAVVETFAKLNDEKVLEAVVSRKEPQEYAKAKGIFYF